MRAGLLAVLLVGCSGDDEGRPSPPIDTAEGTVVCDTLSWDTTAQPFLTTWCTSCHAASLGPGERFGAPESINLDTYDAVLALEDRVQATAVGPDPRMPPVGGASEADKALFARWLECGLPGPPAPVEADCGDAVDIDGPVTSSPCGSGPVRVAGAVEASGGDWSCLCAVDGDLTVAGGAFDAPVLQTVGGAFTVVAATSVAAPRLIATGAVVVQDGAFLDLSRLVTASSVGITAPALVDVDLHDLEAVPGDVRIVGNPALTLVDLSRLTDVGGTLAVTDNAALLGVLGQGYGVRQIGGDLLLQRNPLWQGFYGFGLLEAVGGDLMVSEQARFGIVSGFTALEQVGGDMRIVSNGGLQFLQGFDQLRTIGGAFVVSGNPQLSVEGAFAQLETVGGEVVVSGNPRLEEVDGLVGVHDVGGIVWSDNGAMPGLDGYPDLARVRGDVLVRDMDGMRQLRGFAALEAIDGALTVEGNAVLGAIPGFSSLRTVGSTLDVRNNPQLTSLAGLTGVVSVGADLSLVDNPALLTSPLAGWLGELAVGGDTTISGNAD